MIETELNQKVVVLIGDAQGIGRAIRETFLAQGSIVVDGDGKYHSSFEQATDGAFQLSLNFGSETSVQAFVTTLKEKNSFQIF